MAAATDLIVENGKPGESQRRKAKGL